jgi:cytochrome c oxidase cbb3-type subunit 3
MPSRCRDAACAAVALAALAACGREAREFEAAPPPPSAAAAATLSDLHPGGPPPPQPANPAQDNAWALSEGKRLYDAYNCSGCHAHGGGGFGPPLMDDQWIYGGEPANVHESIVEGRPNGMPSFRGKIPDDQVWELAAYVRSLAGLARKDAAPQRSDHMSAKPAEQSTEKMPPRITGTPP